MTTKPKAIPRKTARKTRARLTDDRIAELLDVAAGVFISEGFAAASLNRIAGLANASKATFYGRFPTKKDLFMAVIERRIQSVLSRVVHFSEEEAMEPCLRSFANSVLTISFSPEQIALIRMISMEATRHPELARHYYELGPRRAEDSLAGYLDFQIRTGRLQGESARTMARQFMNLLTGSRIRWFVLGFDPTPLSQEELHDHAESVLTMFFRAYGHRRRGA